MPLGSTLSPTTAMACSRALHACWARCACATPHPTHELPRILRGLLLHADNNSRENVHGNLLAAPIAPATLWRHIACHLSAHTYLKPPISPLMGLYLAPTTRAARYTRRARASHHALSSLVVDGELLDDALHRLPSSRFLFSIAVLPRTCVAFWADRDGLNGTPLRFKRHSPRAEHFCRISRRVLSVTAFACKPRMTSLFCAYTRRLLPILYRGLARREQHYTAHTMQDDAFTRGRLYHAAC